MEEITAEKNRRRNHSLPHRHVLKPNISSTKLIPVFDASSKQKDDTSLTHYLEKGVNLLSLISGVFQNFGLLKIGFNSDIRKAFLHIILNKRERNFERTGFTIAVLIQPQFLLQKTWTMKIEWNSEVPIAMKTEGPNWLKELNKLTHLKIPR